MVELESRFFPANDFNYERIVPIEFQCEQCKQLIRVPDESVGHQARCPFCQTVQSVPSGDLPSGNATQGSAPPPPPLFDSGSRQPLPPSATTPLPTTSPPSVNNPQSSPFADQPSDNPYRQDPANPYAPQSQFSAGAGFANLMHLAPLGDRFVGIVIDYVFAAICWVPGMVMLGLAEDAGNELMQQVGAAVFFLGLLAQVATQWVLISSRGQSVGKIVMKTRIVTLSGAAPGFLHGVVLRILLFGLFTSAFCMCSPLYPVALLVDGLFIFGERRQCLHDLVASTYVVSDKMNE